jgi:hypothetical protein
MSFKNVYAILVVAICVSCQPDFQDTVPIPDAEPTKAFPGVDPGLWWYFETFESEAAKRGLHVDLISASIQGRIVDIAEQGVHGQCVQVMRSQSGEVIVDNQFWNIASKIAKEMIVFHELGHCFLWRPHLDHVNTDGTCGSIMRSGLGDCADNYKYATRDAYLDELFSVYFRDLDG